jgi:ribulose-phosphate 3-epimerase
MDGHFVPNFAIGYDTLRCIKRITEIPLEAHLAINNPEQHILLCAEAGADIITIHPEVTRHLCRAVDSIKKMGKLAGIAISPHIGFDMLDYVLDDTDIINCMTVNPGFAGQRLLPFTLDKIELLSEKLSTIGNNTLVQVDGNVSFEHIPKMVENGADILVLGTSSLFQRDKPLAERLNDVKDYIASL